MKNLALIGRILFALPFGIIGLNHFLFIDFYLEIAKLTSFIPDSAYMILMSGALLIAASISIILNKYINIACYTLAALLLIFIVTIHIPGLFVADTVKAQISLMELLKDTGLMGGAIMIATYFKHLEVPSKK